ncbi:MAG: wax ester/triacylglycerol synthase family O-acyltransferase [Steroidobacteraceae bacterium]
MQAAHATREAMSGIDLAWLRMERPTNPMTIVGVITLRGRIHIDAVRSLFEERLLRFARFRQLPVHEALGSYWCEDAHFDLEAHVRSLSLPSGAAQAQLEAAVSELASTQLDPRHPLWQVHVVERYSRGSALVLRFHHCYADGVALLRVLLTLTDCHVKRGVRHRSGKPSVSRSWFDQIPLVGTAGAVTSAVTHAASDLVSASLHAIVHPLESLNMAAQIASATRELATIALFENDPPTSLRGALSTHKQVAWADPISLAEVKTMGKALGCTVNDVLIASIAGALGGYLRNQHPKHEAVTIRALVPVNLRGPSDDPQLGNRFGLVFVHLPLGEPNPIARVQAVHRDMETLKASAQPLVGLWLLTALGSLPGAIEHHAVDLLTDKATVVISNVPGPQTAIHLAGARIDRQFFWVPQAGHIGIGVSMLTYDGQVHFGLMADRNLIPRPAQVARTFTREFEKLLLCTVMS